jgi:hypothetical protein
MEFQTLPNVTIVQWSFRFYKLSFIKHFLKSLSES